MVRYGDRLAEVLRRDSEPELWGEAIDALDRLGLRYVTRTYKDKGRIFYVLAEDDWAARETGRIAARRVAVLRSRRDRGVQKSKCVTATL